MQPVRVPHTLPVVLSRDEGRPPDRRGAQPEAPDGAVGGLGTGLRASEVVAIAYNSCRNRHCPKCQARAARRWLEAQQADLLPLDSYHVVFTLPAPISAIAYYNKAVLYDLSFEVAAVIHRCPVWSSGRGRPAWRCGKFATCGKLHDRGGGGGLQ